jgi:hypothetical protein
VADSHISHGSAFSIALSVSQCSPNFPPNIPHLVVDVVADIVRPREQGSPRVFRVWRIAKGREVIRGQSFGEKRCRRCVLGEIWMKQYPCSRICCLNRPAAVCFANKTPEDMVERNAGQGLLRKWLVIHGWRMLYGLKPPHIRPLTRGTRPLHLPTNEPRKLPDVSSLSDTLTSF